MFSPRMYPMLRMCNPRVLSYKSFFYVSFLVVYSRHVTPLSYKLRRVPIQLSVSIMLFSTKVPIVRLKPSRRSIFKWNFVLFIIGIKYVSTLLALGMGIVIGGISHRLQAKLRIFISPFRRFYMKLWQMVCFGRNSAPNVLTYVIN